jgi:membrane associated rhomboid family serine protease
MAPVDTPMPVPPRPWRRLPWVTTTLAVLLFGVFLHTTYGARADDDGSGAALARVLEYWQERPYLSLPSRFAARYADAALRDAAMGAQRAAIAAGQVPAVATVAVEQVELERRADLLLAIQRRRPVERWALRPDLGLAQPGLVTYVFLHGGWGHLLLNLLFLTLLGYRLEPRWGRLRFLTFFVAGGVVAGLGQVLLAGSSEVPVIGASGAIAACAGAYLVSFAGERLALPLLRRRIGRLRGWALPATWVAVQGAALTSLGDPDAAASIVHVAGFSFGGLAAYLLGLWGGRATAGAGVNPRPRRP